MFSFYRKNWKHAACFKEKVFPSFYILLDLYCWKLSDKTKNIFTLVGLCPIFIIKFLWKLISKWFWNLFNSNFYFWSIKSLIFLIFISCLFWPAPGIWIRFSSETTLQKSYSSVGWSHIICFPSQILLTVFNISMSFKNTQQKNKTKTR